MIIPTTLRTLVGTISATAALCALTPPALAAPSALDPGRTRTEDALRAFGAPATRYRAWLTEGRPDPFVAVPMPGAMRARFAEARAARRSVIRVEVLEWRSEGEAARTKLVFQDGLLWYAVLPEARSPDRAALEASLGPATVVTMNERRVGPDAVEPVTILAWPDRGVAWALTLGGAHKVLFATDPAAPDEE